MLTPSRDSKQAGVVIMCAFLQHFYLVWLLGMRKSACWSRLFALLRRRCLPMANLSGDFSQMQEQLYPA